MVGEVAWEEVSHRLQGSLARIGGKRAGKRLAWRGGWADVANRLLANSSV